MPYESDSWMFKAADRVTGTAESLAERAADIAGKVVDSEHTPPINRAAMGALVGFAVVASGIVAGRELVESIQNRE